MNAILGKGDDREIYVAIAVYGSYDESDFTIITVTLDEKVALDAARNYAFPDPCQNFSWVEVWSDGKRVKRIECID